MRARAAIEALRAGVPNRAAIRALGTGESELHGLLVERLEACRAGLDDGRQVRGLVVAGGFGAGKSHLLGFMREAALQRGFAVSLVPISKETPLFDTARMYEAAVRYAEVPGEDGEIVNDDAMTAALHRLRQRHGTEPYGLLERWTADPESGLAESFAALLHLLPRRQIDPELLPEMARFLSGARLSAARLRLWLRDAGAAGMFDVRQPRMAELALQRLRFAPRLFRAAGHAGWCVLLDETELIGRYSVLQRGRAYAELCRWLGLAAEVATPGVVAVAAITDDFVDRVIEDKQDREAVPERLEARGRVVEARLAATAMRVIAREQHGLRAPDEPGLRECLDRVAGLYREAYGWPPPETGIGERRAGKTMRAYIKSWITAWDIERLYGERPAIESAPPPLDYAESPDYERLPDNGEPGED